MIASLNQKQQEIPTIISKEKTQSHNSALSGIRICDFTGQLAGAGATKILATLGAQVIRVEDNINKGGWDIFRGTGPWPDERRGVSLGGAFNNHNIEKLGMTLNMRDSRAKDLLSELISISDVVTENFSKGVLDRWGFSYEEMKLIKPDLIYVSNSGFGHRGPYSDYKTWGPIVQAVSGLTFSSGLPDMPPAGWGFSFMDHTGAYQMAIAILMAIYYRNNTGIGQWVDMSCSEGAATLNGPSLLDFTVNNKKTRRAGNPNSNRSQYPRMAPHGIYPCKGTDRWVAISIRNNNDWARFVEIDELGHLANNSEFQTVDNRLKNQDKLDTYITEWTTPRYQQEIARILQSRKIPAEPVQDPPQRVDHDNNNKSWNLFPVVEHSEIGKIRVDGMPFKLSQTPPRVERGAPALGEHNDFVFKDLMGVNDQELSALYKDEVI